MGNVAVIGVSIWTRHEAWGDSYRRGLQQWEDLLKLSLLSPPGFMTPSKRAMAARTAFLDTSAWPLSRFFRLLATTLRPLALSKFSFITKSALTALSSVMQGAWEGLRRRTS